MSRGPLTTTGELRRLRALVEAGATAAAAARDLHRSAHWAWHWCKHLGLPLERRPHPAPTRAAVTAAQARLAATMQHVKSSGHGIDANRFCPAASAVSETGKENPRAGRGLSSEYIQ